MKLSTSQMKLRIVYLLQVIALGTTALSLEASEHIADKNTSNVENKDKPIKGHKLIVTARKSPLAGFKPTTQSSFLVEPNKLTKIANSITQLVEGSPGVAENSQPGLFQVVSIRGVSRQRILTLLDGVRLSSERRAGVASSFIDPSLMHNIDIIRGPASTYYGSGAMGGVMKLNLKQILGNEISSGFNSVGNENYQNYSWGRVNDKKENYFSLSRRKANNSNDIQNHPLNTHFEQVSALYRNAFDIQHLENIPFLNQSRVNSWIFASQGNNLGRSNSRFPNRIVNIPTESHHILKTAISNHQQWSADFYFHDQDITTQTIRPEQSIIDVKNESQDFGINWQVGWKDDNSIDQKLNKSQASSLFGVDVYLRKNVNSEETINELTSNRISFKQTLDSASKTELATFYSYHYQLNDFRFQAGIRYTTEQSSNKNFESVDNNALTAFTGISYNLINQASPENHLQLNANIGNAFRFPSLTELYFTGTTARGDVIGNANLEAEESINYEIGLNWSNQSNHLKVTLFENNFDQYIERVLIGVNSNGDDILTFENQQNGNIKGIETEYRYDISEKLDLSVIGTIIDGANDLGNSLSDIPSDRASILFNYQLMNWNAQVRLQHRRSKSDVGNGELPTHSANLLSASFQYQINHNWQIKVVGENLFNTEYVGSSDDVATLMPGRSYGVNVVWND